MNTTCDVELPSRIAWRDGNGCATPPPVAATLRNIPQIATYACVVE